MSNSITYHNVISYFEDCDLELGELVLDKATQTLGKRHATRGKISAGLVKARAAKVAAKVAVQAGTATEVAPHGYKADGTPRLRAAKGSKAKNGQVAQVAQVVTEPEAQGEGPEEQETYEATA